MTRLELIEDALRHLHVAEAAFPASPSLSKARLRLHELRACEARNLSGSQGCPVLPVPNQERPSRADAVLLRQTGALLHGLINTHGLDKGHVALEVLSQVAERLSPQIAAMFEDWRSPFGRANTLAMCDDFAALSAEVGRRIALATAGAEGLSDVS
jgi:hypothetical protein